MSDIYSDNTTFLSFNEGNYKVIPNSNLITPYEIENTSIQVEPMASTSKFTATISSKIPPNTISFEVNISEIELNSQRAKLNKKLRDK